MSTLLLSEWLYQILTTWCRCWQAPRPSAPCCQEPPWNSSQGLFVQLFCLLGPFAAVKTAERERQTERGERVSEWWKEKTERERGRWWTEWDRDWVKEGKNWKTPIHILLFCFFATVTLFYLTTGTTESIIWLLQRHLILTTPGKKFCEIWIHYMMNCTAETVPCSVFLWVTRVWKDSEHDGCFGSFWVLCTLLLPGAWVKTLRDQ